MYTYHSYELRQLQLEMYCTMTAMCKDSVELDMHTYHSYELRQLQFEMNGDSLRHVRYRSHLNRVKSFLSSELALNSLLNLLGKLNPCSIYRKGTIMCRKEGLVRQPEAGFLDEIQTKVKSFLFCYSQSPVQSSFIVHCKEKGGKPNRKPYPLPYDLRNPYRNLKSENS
jgi:hypothetical protein